MQVLWWWVHRSRPVNLRIPRYAQPWESTHAHVPFARLLHGTRQRHYGAHGDAVGAACLHCTFAQLNTAASLPVPFHSYGLPTLSFPFRKPTLSPSLMLP